MTIAITSIYAGLIGLLFVALSLRVIAVRRGKRISLGDGDDPDLTKRMRAQGNCAEYAPIGLILLALVEIQGAGALLVHALGLMLLLGRLMHAIALSARPQIMQLRVGGMLLTLFMIIGASIAALFLAVI